MLHDYWKKYFTSARNKTNYKSSSRKVERYIFGYNKNMDMNVALEKILL